MTNEEKTQTFEQFLESYTQSATRHTYHAGISSFLKSVYQTDEETEALAPRYIKEVRSGLLNQTVPLSALVNMMRMQAPSGGFYTGYGVSFSHDSTSTNTETTCLAIMALEAVSYSTGARVHELTFRQVRYCGQFNIMPWAVTLNGLGLTEVEPSNLSLPLPTNTFSTIVPNQNLTRITFLVPSGTYSYTVSGGAPPAGGLYPGSGTVEVRESDVFVNVGVSLSFTCT